MKVSLIVILLLSMQQISLCQNIDKRMFMFGHSLVNYESDNVMNDEGKIAHWIYRLAITDNNTFASTGQFGFLPGHTNLPPIPNWGYQEVPGVWDIDNNETFGDADFNGVLITPGNFMQWQPCYFDYPTDPGLSPLSASEIIFDWVAEQEDSVKYYIYQNWPDMAPFLNNGFPATAQEFADYNEYCRTTFNDWWLEYQDSILSSRPHFQTRMIPVGTIISKLHTDFFSTPIPIADLYEDDAPHGTANTYFLAGLISYMAIYEKPASVNFNIPNSLHPTIANNYVEMVNFIWDELQSFNNVDGVSRVFCLDGATSVDNVEMVTNSINVYPNPSDGLFEISADRNISSVRFVDMMGRVHLMLSEINNISTKVDLSGYSSGVYFVVVGLEGGGEVLVEKILIE